MDNDNPLGSSSVTMEEMEAQMGSATGPKLEDMKLEGESVPELMRGKSVADLIAQNAKTLELLQKSEQARSQAETLAKVAAERSPAPPTPPAPAPEPEMTKEQLSELMQNDPLAAVEYLMDKRTKVVSQQIEDRMRPLYQGTANVVEQSVRTKYAEEFTLLGPEIENAISQISGGKARLTTPQAWDDVIAYVRGQNIDKIVDARMAKAQRDRETETRETQRQNTGFQGTGRRAPSGSSPSGQIDPLKKEIADTLGLSYDDYMKWEKTNV